MLTIVYLSLQYVCSVIPGPNIGLSGPPLPGQPRGMSPHSSGVAPPSQRFQMANPGVAPGPGTAGHHNYPPQPGQAPINLTGPMSQMGNANTQVT
jgi:hypothetical protein